MNSTLRPRIIMPPASLVGGLSRERRSRGIGGGDAVAETRAVPLEYRAKGRRLEGYAALFDTPAEIGDFTEVVKPGAFRAALAANDILALSDHDPNRLLARTRSKTLRLAEDSRGLAFDFDLPDTQLGRDVLALAERGDLGGMSFGFNVKHGGDTWEGRKRSLIAVDLREISVVSAFPAYDGTVISARSRGEASPLDLRVRLMELGQ